MARRSVMNWFERHLNWSLFIAWIPLPFVVNLIILLIAMSFIGSQMSMLFSDPELMVYDPEFMFQTMLGTLLPLSIISSVVNVALFIFFLVVVWWYLGKKERSRMFMFLVLAPWAFVFIFAVFNSFIGEILSAVGFLVGIIILFCLENRSIDYGGDFISEPATDYWGPDTGQFGGYDSEKLRELDYRPAKNVEDIAYGGVVKDVGDFGAPSGEVPPAFPPKAPEETTPEASAQIPPEVSVEPPAESRVEAPPEFLAEVPPEPSVEVPPEVPFETVAESRAEVPPEPSAEVAPEPSAETRAEIPPEAPIEFSVEAVDDVPPETPAELPAEAKVAEEPARSEALKMPILLDDAGAVIKCFYHPDADAVNMCSRCGQYVCGRCNYVTGTHPICRNCWERRGEAPVAGVAAGAGESAKLGKSERRKAEEGERLGEFMQLYEQAAPIISIVIKREADGSPSPPEELMEGLKLRPMLEQAQKLSKPSGKEWQEARKEFEQLLLTCIKVAEAAAEFVSSGEQAVPGEAYMEPLSVDIATANGLMQGLSQKLASLSQSPGD
jgi:hypothetical protein